MRWDGDGAVTGTVSYSNKKKRASEYETLSGASGWA